MNLSQAVPNPRLKLSQLMRSSWKQLRKSPKFSPARQQWEAGQLSRESFDLSRHFVSMIS